jgi:hypothetical protein
MPPDKLIAAAATTNTRMTVSYGSIRPSRFATAADARGARTVILPVTFLNEPFRKTIHALCSGQIRERTPSNIWASKIATNPITAVICLKHCQVPFCPRDRQRRPPCTVKKIPGTNTQSPLPRTLCNRRTSSYSDTAPRVGIWCRVSSTQPRTQMST